MQQEEIRKGESNWCLQNRRAGERVTLRQLFSVNNRIPKPDLLQSPKALSK